MVLQRFEIDLGVDRRWLQVVGPKLRAQPVAPAVDVPCLYHLVGIPLELLQRSLGLALQVIRIAKRRAQRK